MHVDLYILTYHAVKETVLGMLKTKTKTDGKFSCKEA